MFFRNKSTLRLVGHQNSVIMYIHYYFHIEMWIGICLIAFWTSVQLKYGNVVLGMKIHDVYSHKSAVKNVCV